MLLCVSLLYFSIFTISDILGGEDYGHIHVNLNNKNKGLPKPTF